MTKRLLALRRPDDVPRADLERRLPALLSNQPGLRRWALEVAQPGQDLLVAAGLRYDGRPVSDALLWTWSDEPGQSAGLDTLWPIWADLRLEESPGWDRRETDRMGSEAVKMVSFVVRRAEVDRRQFERDYREHVATALVHHPGVCCYVQNLVLDGRGEGAGGIEAVSELWYASADDFRTRFYAGDDSPGIVRADNEEYIDFARTRSLMVGPALTGGDREGDVR